MRISDWSSDVCSSDLAEPRHRQYAKPTLRDIVTPLGRFGANPAIRKNDFLSTCKIVNLSHQTGVGYMMNTIDCSSIGRCRVSFFILGMTGGWRNNMTSTKPSKPYASCVA